jgi:hypothetical protein
MKGFQHNDEVAELLPAWRLREERRIESPFEQLKRVAKAPRQAAFPPKMCGMSVVE